MEQIFDLLVLGGGPAGYLAAERAGGAGLSVALIEARALGGVCLNEGCIPSKSLLYCAKAYEYAAHGESYGVTSQNAQIDQRAVIERKNKVVKKLVAGVSATLKKQRVTVITGRGVIQGRDESGFMVEVNAQVVRGKQLLIAAGSEAVVPPISGVKEGLDSGRVLTNREILDLEDIPASLVVIGGGVIGLEMASYYQSVGSQVTVVEMLPQIAGQTDTEIAVLLQKVYEKKGVVFHLSAKVTAVTDAGVTFEKDGVTTNVPADKILLSVGRRASTAQLGVESLGLLTERGAIVTDAHMRTNVAGVYAAGDVNGKSMLAHTAYREAEVVVNQICGVKDEMRYHAIPSVIYTTPEVAGMGETEESAKAKGLDFQVAKLPMSYSGRYLAETEQGEGICKILIDSKYRYVLGAHMMGSYASEIIYGVGTWIETEMRVEDIQKLVFPHPTVGEILREVIFQF